MFDQSEVLAVMRGEPAGLVRLAVTVAEPPLRGMMSEFLLSASMQRPPRFSPADSPTSGSWAAPRLGEPSDSDAAARSGAGRSAERAALTGAGSAVSSPSNAPGDDSP